MELTVPFRELINVVALAQALMFAAFLLTSRMRVTAANRILIVVLLIFATIKADQLYQFMDGLNRAPEFGFIFTPVQWLMTPSLYFFVLAKVTRGFHFKRQDLLHLLPALMSFVYLWATYYHLPVEGKIAYLESGGLREPLNRLIIPLSSDAIQLTYLVAALHKLTAYGMTLRGWFSHIDNRNHLWIRRLLIIWAAIFLLHMFLVISVGFVHVLLFWRVIVDLLNVTHLAILNTLILMGLISHFETPTPFDSPLDKEKYSASTQSGGERKALFERACTAMQEKRAYLEMELTLGDLAERLAVTSRELSEAINGEGQRTFYDFVNQYRVKEAQRLLINDPAGRILQIAHQAGFGSKSTFNQLFKQSVGQTPSEYRKINLNS